MPVSIQNYKNTLNFLGVRETPTNINLKTIICEVNITYRQITCRLCKSLTFELF